MKFFRQHRKWLVLVLYLIIIAGVWLRRSTIFYQKLSVTGVPEIVVDCVLIAFALIVFIGIFEFLRAPWWKRQRMDTAMHQAPMKNGEDQYPRLLAVCTDPKRTHGKIYKINSKGFSSEDFQKYAARIETVLNRKIYHIERGKKSSRILLYVIPFKYVKPTHITPSDENVGSYLKIEDLINLLVVGATGTGKTVAIKTILAKICRCCKSPEIWILDYKNIDFRAFADEPLMNYFSYNDCATGLNKFYDAFKAQQATGKAGKPQYLICDEWGAFILSREKREGDALKQKLSELLMMGRGYNFFVIIGMQRANAEYFVSGSRDNFEGVLALGNLSKEQKQMLFPEEQRAHMDMVSHRGEGYLYVSGNPIEHIRIVVDDPDDLDQIIRYAI